MSSQIYFEAQDDDFQLCGQHSLNNLLQGAYFTAFDLGDIGAKLDEQEQMLYNDATKAIEQINCYRNVSLSGSFSIDVLIAALSQLNLSALPLSHPLCAAVKDKPWTEEGFLMNYDGHWMVFRKMSDIWYNLNSISNYQFMAAQPVQISELYLQSTLHKLTLNNYQIFVIRGTFPKDTTNATKMEELKSEYKYYNVCDIKTHPNLQKISNERLEQNKQRKLQKQIESDSANYVFSEGFHIKWTVSPLEKRDTNSILNAQKYMCASCGERLLSNFLSKTSYVYCEYLGSMHCVKCHKRDKAYIPWQILHRLNCRPMNVCVSAKQFLDRMYAMPCITMDMFGSNAKIAKNRKLQKLKRILCELKGIYAFMTEESKCEKGLAVLHKSYVYNGLLSLNDIVNVFNINTLAKLEVFSLGLQRHIRNGCEVCMECKGMECKICKGKDRIYKFESEGIIGCNKCDAKYHKKCWNTKLKCAKCD